MNKTLHTTLLTLNLLSFIVPFAFNLYFSPTLNLFTAAFLFFLVGICALIWLTAICLYCFFSKKESSIYKIISANVFAIIVSVTLFFTGSINFLGDYIFYKMNEDKFNILIEEFKSNDWINQLDIRNGINNLELNGMDEKSKEVNSLLSKKLNQSEVFRFEKENDIYFFFTGGVLNHSIGFAYSEYENSPEKLGYEKLLRWKHLTDNWYTFGY